MLTSPTILQYSFFFHITSILFFVDQLLQNLLPILLFILLLFIVIIIIIITHAIIIIIITIIIIIIITITITALYIIYGNTTECIQSVAKRVTIKTRQERKQRFDV